jgi:hypothetical protein
MTAAIAEGLVMARVGDERVAAWSTDHLARRVADDLGRGVVSKSNSPAPIDREYGVDGSRQHLIEVDATHSSGRLRGSHGIQRMGVRVQDDNHTLAASVNGDRGAAFRVMTGICGVDAQRPRGCREPRERGDRAPSGPEVPARRIRRGTNTVFSFVRHLAVPLHLSLQTTARRVPLNIMKVTRP